MPPLDCLLCDWLAGRDCRRGCANDKRLLVAYVAREYKTGNTTLLCWWKLLPDLWTGHPNNQSLHQFCYSRSLWLSFPILSVFVFCSEFGTSTDNYRHCVSFTLSTNNGSPWVEIYWLGPNSRSTWKAKFQTYRIYTKCWQSTHALRTCSVDRYVDCGSFHSNRRRVMTCSPRYQFVSRMWYTWRNGCVSICRSPGTPLWVLRSTACEGQRHTKWMCGGKTSGVQHWIPWTWRPVAVEDYQTGDESSYSASSPG